MLGKKMSHVDGDFERTMRDEIVSGLRNDIMMKMHREEAIKEDIHLVYVHKSRSGKVLSRIDIPLKDIL